MTSKLDYPILIERLSTLDGGGFVATVPDLPGCMSNGETQEQAIENARDAIDCWIDEARRLHRAVPPPARSRMHA